MLNSAAYVVTKIEQKDRNDQPQPPFTTSTLQQQASIRLHMGASGRCRTPSGSTRASNLGARAGRAHHLHANRQHAGFERRAAMVRTHIQTTPRPALPAGQAELLQVRQERPGGPRGDPPDRPDQHAAARAAVPGPRPVPAVHADLQPLRRQPDDAGGRRGHERRDPGRPGRVQGQGPDREVRRLPQGAGRPASKRT